MERPRAGSGSGLSRRSSHGSSEHLAAPTVHRLHTGYKALSLVQGIGEADETTGAMACKRETESRKGLCYLPRDISEESDTRQESNPGSIPPGQTSHIFLSHFGLKGFPGGSDGKESAYNAGNPGLIPESGRSPAEGVATYSSIFTWKIPWTEEPGGL